MGTAVTTHPVPTDYRRKLTLEQVAQIRERISSGAFETYSALAREFGISRQGIMYIMHPERCVRGARAPRTIADRRREREYYQKRTRSKVE